MKTTEFVRKAGCSILAEIGVGIGDTSEAFARYLNGRGELHLVDFAEKVQSVKARLLERGYRNIVAHGNSRKIYDDYNWSLMKVLRASSTPVFEYVYLDGAHTWHHDALAYFLVDRLLKIGGFIEFDDYGWSHMASPTVNPRIFPFTQEAFTEEQITTCQVGLVIDLLVKRDARYRTIVTNRIYEKLG